MPPVQYIPEHGLTAYSKDEPNLGPISGTAGAFLRGDKLEGGCNRRDGLCITVLLDTTGKTVVGIMCPSYSSGGCLLDGGLCPNKVPTATLASKSEAA